MNFEKELIKSPAIKNFILRLEILERDNCAHKNTEKKHYYSYEDNNRKETHYYTKANPYTPVDIQMIHLKLQELLPKDEYEGYTFLSDGPRDHKSMRLTFKCFNISKIKSILQLFPDYIVTYFCSVRNNTFQDYHCDISIQYKDIEMKVIFANLTTEDIYKLRSMFFALEGATPGRSLCQE